MDIDAAYRCTEPIEARFAMTARYWSPIVSKAYVAVLMVYSENHAETVIAEALRNRNEPPTDRELEGMLIAQRRGSTDLQAFKPPANWLANSHRDGKRIFEMAFCQKLAEMPVYEKDANGRIARERGEQYGKPVVVGYGQPVPEEWAKKFEKWRVTNATDADLGADLTRGAAPEVFRDYDPFDGEE